MTKVIISKNSKFVKILQKIQIRLLLLFVLFGISAYYLGSQKNEYALYWPFLLVLIFVFFTATFFFSLNQFVENYKQQKKAQKRSKEIQVLKKNNKELLDLFADVIYKADANDRIVYIKHSEKIFGYKEKELLGRETFEFVHPKDSIKIKELLKKNTAQSNQKINNYKIRLITKTGDIRYCLLSNHVIFKKGKQIGMEGVLRDITSFEQLNQNLKKEKEKLQTMYDNLHNSYLALGKLNAQISALAEINTTFSSSLKWRDKLYYIIASIRTFVKGDETLLFVKESNEKKFILKHASVDYDFWEDLELSSKNSLVKQIQKDKRVIKHLEIKNFLDSKRAEAKEYKAIFAIPVIINSKVVGIFIIFFKNSDHIKTFPEKLALAYTSQMSIALMMSGTFDHSLKKIF